jgi:hypothetical protein
VMEPPKAADRGTQPGRAPTGKTSRYALGVVGLWKIFTGTRGKSSKDGIPMEEEIPLDAPVDRSKSVCPRG